MSWFSKIAAFVPNPEDPDFAWDIESVDTNEDAIQVLQHYQVPYEAVTFDNGETVLKFKDPAMGKEVIWSGGIMKGALEFIYDLQDYELESYVKMPEESFWDSVGEGMEAYHATPEENVESILANGIYAECRTRGISNRGMGCAVFASFNEHAIDSYGSAVFAINLGAMLADGFTPEVTGETPLEEANHRQEVAYRLGIHDVDFTSEYSSDGLDQDTIAIYENIPPKYIRLI